MPGQLHSCCSLEPSHILLSGSLWSPAGAELLVSRQAGLLPPASLLPAWKDRSSYHFSAHLFLLTPHPRESLQKAGWRGAQGALRTRPRGAVLERHVVSVPPLPSGPGATSPPLQTPPASCSTYSYCPVMSAWGADMMFWSGKGHWKLADEIVIPVTTEFTSFWTLDFLGKSFSFEDSGYLNSCPLPWYFPWWPPVVRPVFEHVQD